MYLRLGLLKLQLYLNLFLNRFLFLIIKHNLLLALVQIVLNLLRMSTSTPWVYVQSRPGEMEISFNSAIGNVSVGPFYIKCKTYTNNTIQDRYKTCLVVIFDRIYKKG